MVGKKIGNKFWLRFIWEKLSTSVSIPEWEKNVNRTLLTNLALEGILHSKQHNCLTKIGAQTKH